ncbi:MAG: chromate transporter [Chloroflexi bacterium]|nr:MAG: chromate transporter [Chloroflexota bacterium]
MSNHGRITLRCLSNGSSSGASFMKLQDPRPSKWLLFRIWASVGLQSFGGGASTTFLIQRAFIEKHRWLSMEEFMYFWNLCVLTPGINLVALTVLIGKKLGGVWGIVVSLAGLLLPSAVITCLLAATFVQIENVAAVQAVLRGVIPATGGIMLLVGLNFALPLIRRSYKEGMLYLLASGVVLIACALAVILLKLSVIIVILGAILLGALFFSPRRGSPLPEEEQGEQQ